MKKILIVDDDAGIGNMLEDKPDLVLLDLMLPGLGGEEVLPHFKGIPVIVMSARADVEDKVKLLLGGAADYVTKPFSGKELIEESVLASYGALVKSGIEPDIQLT